MDPAQWEALCSLTCLASLYLMGGSAAEFMEGAVTTGMWLHVDSAHCLSRLAAVTSLHLENVALGRPVEQQGEAAAPGQGMRGDTSAALLEAVAAMPSLRILALSGVLHCDFAGLTVLHPANGGRAPIQTLQLQGPSLRTGGCPSVLAFPLPKSRAWPLLQTLTSRTGMWPVWPASLPCSPLSWPAASS